MRSQEISARRYRRPFLAPAVTAGALLLAAIPGTAAHAAPPPGPDHARHRSGGQPADYEEVDCEGPASHEGDVYTLPPKTEPPKSNPAGPPEGPRPHAPDGTRPHAPAGGHPKTPEGTHPKAPEAAHPKGPEATQPKAPEAHPKAPEGTHPKAPEAAHPKAPEGTHPKAPESMPPKSPAAASARHGSLPHKWPNNIPDRDDALRMLDELDVKPLNSKGYARKHFGSACWVPHGKLRCSTRDLALRQQSLVPVTREGKCRVTGGQWHSEYDDRTMADPTHLDVDHIVPLRHAWGSGASDWSAEKRMEFANDLTATPQLIVVSTWSNRRKGDKGPDQWLPHDGAQCPYSKAWIAVKDYYGLSVTKAEKFKLEQVLEKCAEAPTGRPPGASEPRG
ncbi:DUF1524 domain-containing protein [Streptomyces sp. NPDC053048]|uniref:GmrSD restriction endonuclease domain-containing protein n=1 Tax=Streptomyces sp. NPDC053048 TaxID=3365694 RepID=UPI0037D94771